ncbi:hypothetical protein CLOM_g19774, partial [Closterium sp. NIES-68]
LALPVVQSKPPLAAAAGGGRATPGGGAAPRAGSAAGVRDDGAGTCAARAVALHGGIDPLDVSLAMMGSLNGERSSLSSSPSSSSSQYHRDVKSDESSPVVTPPSTRSTGSSSGSSSSSSSSSSGSRGNGGGGKSTTSGQQRSRTTSHSQCESSDRSPATVNAVKNGGVRSPPATTAVTVGATTASAKKPPTGASAFAEASANAPSARAATAPTPAAPAAEAERAPLTASEAVAAFSSRRDDFSESKASSSSSPAARRKGKEGLGKPVPRAADDSSSPPAAAVRAKTEPRRAANTAALSRSRTAGPRVPGVAAPPPSGSPSRRSGAGGASGGSGADAASAQRREGKTGAPASTLTATSSRSSVFASSAGSGSAKSTVALAAVGRRNTTTGISTATSISSASMTSTNGTSAGRRGAESLPQSSSVPDFLSAAAAAGAAAMRAAGVAPVTSVAAAAAKCFGPGIGGSSGGFGARADSAGSSNDEWSEDEAERERGERVGESEPRARGGGSAEDVNFHQAWNMIIPRAATTASTTAPPRDGDDSAAAALLPLDFDSAGGAADSDASGASWEGGSDCSSEADGEGGERGAGARRKWRRRGAASAGGSPWRSWWPPRITSTSATCSDAGPSDRCAPGAFRCLRPQCFSPPLPPPSLPPPPPPYLCVNTSKSSPPSALASVSRPSTSPTPPAVPQLPRPPLPVVPPFLPHRPPHSFPPLIPPPHSPPPIPPPSFPPHIPPPHSPPPIPPPQVFKGQLMGCEVAVKRLDGGGWQGPDEYCTELRVLSRAHHPHIVLLMGHCPKAMCLVYEYLPGGSLADYLVARNTTGAAAAAAAGNHPVTTATRPALHWSDRVRILSEVAGALVFLHHSDPPVAHRDLKPHNVLLDLNLRTKLADVGLARLIDTSADAGGNITARVRGTAGYIDPEEVVTCEISVLSDVYALGIIMLQLLTGYSNVNQVHKLLASASAVAVSAAGGGGEGGGGACGMMNDYDMAVSMGGVGGEVIAFSGRTNTTSTTGSSTTATSTSSNTCSSTSSSGSSAASSPSSSPSSARSHSTSPLSLMADAIASHLDPSAGAWPLPCARALASLALRCACRQRRLRPDLALEVHPALVRLSSDAAHAATAAQAAAACGATVSAARSSPAASPVAAGPVEGKAGRSRQGEAGGAGLGAEAVAGAGIRRNGAEGTHGQLLCPLSKAPMSEPVVAADGFTYERRHMQQWLAASSLSPVTGQPLPHTFLTPNNALKMIS